MQYIMDYYYYCIRSKINFGNFCIFDLSVKLCQYVTDEFKMLFKRPKASPTKQSLEIFDLWMDNLFNNRTISSIDQMTLDQSDDSILKSSLTQIWSLLSVSKVCMYTRLHKFNFKRVWKCDMVFSYESFLMTKI